MSLKGEMQELYYAISADIEHGECFYDKGMFDEFISNLDKMKEVAQRYFNENKEEDDEDEDVWPDEIDHDGLTRIEETF